MTGSASTTRLLAVAWTSCLAYIGVVHPSGSPLQCAPPHYLQPRLPPPHLPHCPFAARCGHPRDCARGGGGEHQRGQHWRAAAAHHPGTHTGGRVFRCAREGQPPACCLSAVCWLLAAGYGLRVPARATRPPAFGQARLWKGSAGGSAERHGWPAPWRPCCACSQPDMLSVHGHNPSCLQAKASGSQVTVVIDKEDVLAKIGDLLKKQASMGRSRIAGAGTLGLLCLWPWPAVELGAARAIASSPPFAHCLCGVHAPDPCRIYHATCFDHGLASCSVRRQAGCARQRAKSAFAWPPLCWCRARPLCRRALFLYSRPPTQLSVLMYLLLLAPSASLSSLSPL